MYLTVTLNPALDKIVYVDRLTIGEVNPLEIKETLAAGKGVDVSKVLRDLGHPVTACGFLGNNLAAVFQRLNQVHTANASSRALTNVAVEGDEYGGEIKAFGYS